CDASMVEHAAGATRAPPPLPTSPPPPERRSHACLSTMSSPPCEQTVHRDVRAVRAPVIVPNDPTPRRAPATGRAAEEPTFASTPGLGLSSPWEVTEEGSDSWKPYSYSSSPSS